MSHTGDHTGQGYFSLIKLTITYLHHCLLGTKPGLWTESLPCILHFVPEWRATRPLGSDQKDEGAHSLCSWGLAKTTTATQHSWALSGLMQPGDLVTRSSHHSPPGSTALRTDSRPPARGKEKEQPSPTAQPQ